MIFDRHIAAFDKTGFTQPLAETASTLSILAPERLYPTPTTGSAACCARAASGHAAAAPPRSVMNSRRFMQSIPDRIILGRKCPAPVE